MGVNDQQGKFPKSKHFGKNASGGKPGREFTGVNTPMFSQYKHLLKVQAIFHDASVGLEFMTEDLVEAEEMPQQLLTHECVAEVRVLDEPQWVSL